jgi:hypothetical protein
MILEAAAANCFSSTFVLKVDGRAAGKYEGRWLGEGVDVALTGRRHLRFEKAGWVGSHFLLTAGDEKEPLGEADRGGLLTTAWDLKLSTGPARLERAGWFATGYVVRQGGRECASVNRLGPCSRGWAVEGDGLTEEDLLLIGLVYHTVQRRQAAQHGAAGGHAAGS